MSSTSLLKSEYKNKCEYNKLKAVEVKTDNMQTNNLTTSDNYLDIYIDNLSYIGINMAPCEYCKNNKGYHYHNIDKNISSKGDNYIDNKHMCMICMKNPGKLHIHIDES